MLHIIFSLLVSMQAPAAPTNYSVVQDGLKKIAQENPTTTELFDIGLSDSGDPIMGLKIGNGETPDLIVATHHGNEYGSTGVAMGAADAFAKNPIVGHTVYIIPVLNISGYNNRNRYERTPSGSVDQNRDYPGPCATTQPFRSKATKALADFIDKKNIVSSATLHTYWPAVLYPWGFSTKDITTSYESTFINLVKASAVESGYAVGNSKELLYAADGAFEDYAFWKHGVWSLLFEMGKSHNPSQSDIKRMIDVNVPGFRRFFENAPKERAANHDFTGKCDYTRALQRTHLE
ncbi:M14 family metallopeptidase [Bdellovibrio svalbardensis]|uniref:M14 family metallopeptidase n=1 Tax=Bdellovibrio svalbardensis TaxID=2972972 RepID=A0ABT6DK41_9BACT|nr:M14 family metallopeptidase [Bdellovibrio svalbardensis]MDG0817244.1 M14 family metallopeptidase [Bdellovibrio svalbardensis]